MVHIPEEIINYIYKFIEPNPVGLIMKHHIDNYIKFDNIIRRLKTNYFKKQNGNVINSFYRYYFIHTDYISSRIISNIYTLTIVKKENGRLIIRNKNKKIIDIEFN